MSSIFKPSLNWLLVFIPVTLLLERAHVSEPLLFTSAALAIIPIAGIVIASTEDLAKRTGDAVGGLLNATFGNAPELIIALVALKAGFFDMVRASIIGAILANLLLCMGIAFFLGGLRHHDQKYNPGPTRLYSSMMLIAAISLAIPSAFHRLEAPEGPFPQEGLLNLSTAIALLAAYVLYLVFLLKTHPDYFVSASGAAGGHDHHGPQWSVPRAIGSLVVASVFVAWMSEILVGAAEGTGKALGMSEVFIGVVLLAVVGGAAGGFAPAAVMARKNKVDLTIGIAMGASMQIALFVAPVLVLASYFIAPHPLQLAFSRPEIVTLFLAVLIGAMVSGDGQSNWYKGIQLVIIYCMIAMLFYFMPVGGQ